MKKLFLIGIFLLAAFFAKVSPVLAAENISSFQSSITINQDTSINITEVISYYTSVSKHGIYRYIPVRYHRNGLNYTARVTDVSVVDDNGRKIPFETTYESGNINLKIGDPDPTFSGEQIYVISYRVENAIQQFETPELFWDITGEGWQINIDKTVAQVTSPVGDITQIECFSGEFGGNDGLCESTTESKDTAIFTYDHPISYGDNVTVAVKISPTNSLVFPTPLEKALKKMWDNSGLLAILLPAGVMGFWWWKNGRDRFFVSPNVFNKDETKPQYTAHFFNRRTIPFIYEPLKELSPGEAGALMRERVDTPDVVAEIMELARKKYLKIERTDKKKLLGTETDYVLTRLKVGDAKLPEHQKYLLERLFAKGTTVKLSDLKGSFYTSMSKVKTMITSSLTKQGYFRSNPGTVRGVAFAAAFVMDFIVLYWMIHLATQGILWAIPLYIVGTLASLMFAYFMPAKTAVGSNLAMQARGLKETISRGAWREKIKEKHLFIEEILPFAVAFGVVDKLSRDMEDLNIKPPEYLQSGLSHWSTASFVHSFQSQANSTLTYNPNSSSSSGGSGFSGGGSSGGGGGGGGGGSW